MSRCYRADCPSPEISYEEWNRNDGACDYCGGLTPAQLARPYHCYEDGRYEPPSNFGFVPNEIYRKDRGDAAPPTDQEVALNVEV